MIGPYGLIPRAAWEEQLLHELPEWLRLGALLHVCYSFGGDAFIGRAYLPAARFAPRPWDFRVCMGDRHARWNPVDLAKLLLVA